MKDPNWSVKSTEEKGWLWEMGVLETKWHCRHFVSLYTQFSILFGFVCFIFFIFVGKGWGGGYDFCQCRPYDFKIFFFTLRSARHEPGAEIFYNHRGACVLGAALWISTATGHLFVGFVTRWPVQGKRSSLTLSHTP